MMFKRLLSVFITLSFGLLLYVSAVIVQAEDEAPHLEPVSASVGVPSAAGPRAITKIYANPVRLSWGSTTFSDHYKGNVKFNGKVVRKFYVGTCGGSCYIDVNLSATPRTYTWTVKAYDYLGNVIGSYGIGTFATSKPKKPGLVGPANGAVVSNTGVQLEVKAASGGKYFKVAIVEPGGALVESDWYAKAGLCVNKVCSFSYTPTGDVLPSGEYSWYVWSSGDFGETQSNVWTFNVP